MRYNSSFTLYIDILLLLHREGVLPCWSNEDLEKLKRKIETFKMTGKTLFSKIQVSVMKTQKLQMLNHIVSALMDT